MSDPSLVRVVAKQGERGRERECVCVRVCMHFRVFAEGSLIGASNGMAHVELTCRSRTGEKPGMTRRVVPLVFFWRRISALLFFEQPRHSAGDHKLFPTLPLPSNRKSKLFPLCNSDAMQIVYKKELAHHRCIKCCCPENISFPSSFPSSPSSLSSFTPQTHSFSTMYLHLTVSPMFFRDGCSHALQHSNTFVAQDPPSPLAYLLACFSSFFPGFILYRAPTSPP
ncbi:MAG: hypothetical protein BYD32DRAFT_271053 [Podila humilis]|nr:MAG: hypothetical protein BYD32DRAFT_271053 [Podila humilis]